MKAFESENKTFVLAFKFHGRRHLEYLWRVVVALKSDLFWNNRATTTHHNYSRCEHPGNLKLKTSVSNLIFFEYKPFHWKKFDQF